MNDRKIGLEDLEEINRQNELKKKENKKRKNKKERKSIFEKFSTKENIIIFSFLLIFLIIAFALIKKFDPYDEIDYRKITIEKMLSESETITDRDTYWILNNIVSYLLASESQGGVLELNYKYSTEEYYEVLTDDYKIFLNKEKYLELMNNFITNYRENYEILQSNVSDELPIRKVYKYNLNSGEYYIAKMNTSEDSYIGIELFRNKSSFKIFYIQ